MVDKAYDDDLLDLDLSHEPDATTPNNNNNDTNNSLYPAFESIDDQGPAYNNTFEENAPMLGQSLVVTNYSIIIPNLVAP